MSDRRIKTLSFSLTTDVAGDATSTSSIDINGEILAIEVNYSATAAAGTDLTIATAYPAENVLVLTDTNTDGVWYPRRKVDDNAGTAAPAGDNLFSPYILQGSVTATIAQGGNAKTSTVKVYWR